MERSILLQNQLKKDRVEMQQRFLKDYKLRKIRYMGIEEICKGMWLMRMWQQLLVLQKQIHNLERVDCPKYSYQTFKI